MLTTKPRDMQNIEHTLEKIVNVDASQIQQRIELQNNSDISPEIFTQLGELEEYLTIYCSRTGQAIKYRSENEVINMLKIHKLSRTIDLLKREMLQQIMPIWKYTDGQALNELVKHDPVGYFVYAAGLILGGGEILTSNRLTDEIRYKLLMSKVICYQQAQEQPLPTIIHLNEIMCRYLSIIQTTKAGHTVKFKTHNLAKLFDNPIEDFLNEITNGIKNVIIKGYKSGKIKRVSYADAVDIQMQYQGYSAFRQQKKLRGMTELEHVEYLINDELDKYINRYDNPFEIDESNPIIMPKPKPKPLRTSNSIKIKPKSIKEKPSVLDILTRKKNK